MHLSGYICILIKEFFFILDFFFITFSFFYNMYAFFLFYQVSNIFLFYQVSNIHEIFEALQEFESDIMSGDFPPADINYYVHVSFCFTRCLTSMRYLKRSRSLSPTLYLEIFHQQILSLSSHLSTLSWR